MDDTIRETAKYLRHGCSPAILVDSLDNASLLSLNQAIRDCWARREREDIMAALGNGTLLAYAIPTGIFHSVKRIDGEISHQAGYYYANAVFTACKRALKGHALYHALYPAGTRTLPPVGGGEWSLRSFDITCRECKNLVALTGVKNP